MMKSNKKNTLVLGILTAIAASLCCITPVLAILAGVSGVAATFSWLEPLRPYLISVSVIVLAFAWYQQLKPKKEDIDCECEDDQKPSFWQGKVFLGIVTVVSALLLTFPSYSNLLFKTDNITTSAQGGANEKATFFIDGMTCEGCELSVDFAINKNKGIIRSSSSYKEGKAEVTFNTDSTSAEKLARAIELETGYKVTAIK